MKSTSTLLAVLGAILLVDASYIQFTQAKIQKAERELDSLREEVSILKIERGDPTDEPPNRYFTVEKVLDENHFVAFVGGDIYSDEYKLYKLSNHGFVEKKSYVPTPGGNSALVPHFKPAN